MTDMMDSRLVLGSPYFDPNGMYLRVKTAAEFGKMKDTQAALLFMKEKHKDGKRESIYGFEAVYAVHPLTMACHALTMGIRDDWVIAAALLHDVLEETDTKPEELPVGDEVREIVKLLSYDTYVSKEERKNRPNWKEEIKPEYYRKISRNPRAELVKCLDRCNNLSTMADGFKKPKMVKYVKQTEKHVLPLLNVVKEVPAWNNAAWLMRYQMVTMVEAFKRLL